MKIKYSIFVLWIVISVKALAGIPTVDYVQAIQQLLNYLEQLESGLNQIEGLEKQADTLKGVNAQLEAISGAKGIAGLLNSDLFKDLRRAIPSDAVAIIEDLAAGRVPKSSADFKKVLGAVYKIYPSVDQAYKASYAELKKQAISTQRRQNSIAVTQTAAVHTSMELTATNVITMEELIKQIDKTQDLKASVDLNSRIQAEVGLMINQLIKLQTLNSMAASEGKLDQIQVKALMDATNNLRIRK